MSQKIEINAELRSDVGKGASRRLRRSGDRVPGIIYGAEDPPQNLTLNAHELAKAMQSESFFSQIVDVKVDGTSQQAVVRDLQRNPASEKVLHVDFLRISANKPIHVSVPLHFVNEDRCKGVRLGGGTLVHAMTEVEISCLPGDLPEYLEVYMAELDLGEIIHLSDLALPNGVTLVALTHEDDRAVVSVQAPRGAAEEEEEAAEAAAPEAAEEEESDDEAAEED
ncbi:MAG: 50S ribosomal protein L25/general stress protein Ctc [Pseudomonadales bacterium]|jgi:large subunit ribosomal protein L25